MGVLGFVAREMSQLPKEVVVCPVQAFERELKTLAPDFLEPRQGLLQLGEFGSVVVVVEGNLVGEIGILASLS